MTRPTLDQTYMQVAREFAKRATCSRRQVGAVITGNGYILSSGYNGSFPGSQHCIDVPCAGAGLPSGSGLDLCMSAHAEQNAILNKNSAEVKGCTIYTAMFPCNECTKMII